MLHIQNLTILNNDSNKEVISNLNMSVGAGRVDYIVGENGSGKSSLVNTIMGVSNLSMISGKILFQKSISAKSIDISILDIDERANLGIFLGYQNPVEVPGVSLFQFLRLIYNSKLSKSEQLPVFKFRKVLHEKCEMINYPKLLLERNLNEDMSGGEKKKTEILQMLVLEPTLIMLDEIDSGLDRSSIKDIFEGIRNYLEINQHASAIIISHYDKVYEYLPPTNVWNLSQGKMKKTKI